VLVVRPPSPALAPLVESLWYFTGELPHARERILPSGAMQLLVNLHADELRAYDGDRVHVTRGAIVVGAHAHPFAIDTAAQRAIAGVNFRPGGAGPFVGSCDELRGAHVDLDALWGTAGATLRERLLEQPTPHAILRTLDAIVASSAKSLTVDGLITHVVGALERGASVATVLADTSTTPARLIRRFAGAVGLTPKRFARVRRFNAVLVAIARGRPVPWAHLAVDCGYFDQAHMIGEFRAFSGLTPTSYRPRGAGDPHHVPLEEISNPPPPRRAMLRA
jgi:AraC-like DNA-binding protein